MTAMTTKGTTLAFLFAHKRHGCLETQGFHQGWFGYLCTSAFFDFLAEAVALVEQALPPHLQELDLTGEELRH
jgi:hypothetical protein